MDPVSTFIVGAQKSGTTALYTFLNDHPDIQFGFRKELHVFDNEQIDWSEPVDQVFEQYFDQEEKASCRIDATPMYMYWPPAMQRLHNYNPNAKILVLLRDPVERAYSHWRMKEKKKTATIGFSEAIRQGRSRFDSVHPSYSYVERGFYAAQLERIYQLFPSKQVLVLMQKELLENHEAVLNRVCDFIGVDRFETVPPSRTVFSSGALSVMSDSDRQYLSKVYRRANQRLKVEYGIDFLSVESKDEASLRNTTFQVATDFPMRSGLRELPYDVSSYLPISEKATIQWIPYMVMENLLTPLLPKLRNMLKLKQLPDDYNHTFGQLGKVISHQIARWNQQQGLSFEATVVMLPTDMEYPYDVPDNIICLRTSMVSYKRRPQDIAMPLPHLSWEESMPPSSNGSVGFCGVPNNISRRRLLGFLQNQEVETNFIFRDRFWGRIREHSTPTEVERMRLEYEHNMLNNTFVVCSRGAGNYSIRFYETLRAGRIPILLDTDMVFPLQDEIEYDSIIICEKTPEALLLTLQEWVEHRDLIAIQKECRRIWEEYLYFPKFLGHLPALIQQILS
jgi:hypothetical protein